MDGESRRIIAVCASWEDEENLNLILGQMIRATEGQDFLPLFIPFVRNSIDSRGAESLREFVSVFDVPNLAGIMLLGEMIRSDAINRALIRFAQEKKVPVFMLEHDYLTGLYNRRGFLRELERRLQMQETQGMILTLFAMDMDRLKSVNDMYGHHEGDAAIQCLAYALQQETEGKGICARYGGDEFAFALLSDSSFLPEMEQIRARIEKTARKKCGLKDYSISASLGACACAVRNRPSLDQLLAEADRALYADKSRRRACGNEQGPAR